MPTYRSVVPVVYGPFVTYGSAYMEQGRKQPRISLNLGRITPLARRRIGCNRVYRFLRNAADRAGEFVVNIESAISKRAAKECLRPVFMVRKGVQGVLRIKSPAPTSGMR